MPQCLTTDSDNFWQQLKIAVHAARLADDDVVTGVAGIVDAVRSGGDTAVREAAARFDGDAKSAPHTINLAPIAPEQLRLAWEACDAATKEDFDTIYQRVDDYHRRQLPAAHEYSDALGNKLGWKWLPIPSVGLYVPGGTAVYPSSIFMMAVPAQVAGVQRVIIASPAKSGKISAAVLAAAYRCNVSEVYPIGGAQAIAAMAYGTETLRAVDLIAGPGNKWVTAAKRLVAGDVGIDMVAGPSEVVIIADKTANPAHVALDLLAQAEHDHEARAIVISDSAALLQMVHQQVEQRLAHMTRRAIASHSWRHNALAIQTRCLKEAMEVSNYIAPEHLQIATSSPHSLLGDITNAGAVFVGHATAEVFGDYVAGASHVLPTARAARFASGIGVTTFMKRISFTELSASGVNSLTPVAQRMAEREGLDGHAASARARLHS